MKTFKTILPSALLATTVLVAPTALMAQEDVIVVRGQNIPDEKKSTSEISSILDEEAFTRQGDSDVAEALARVTGISITDGKFVVVRGLNERYNSSTLNGSPLPSPEPLKRTAPLDLFPTSVLRGTLVQKTFSPQFSGEFGGAVIDLRTKSVPSEDFLEAKIGFSLNDETSFQDGLFYEGSNTDVFGYDDGLRELPGFVEGLLNSDYNGVVRGDDAVQNALDTSFEQSKTLLINEDDAPGNGSGSVAFGKVFDTDGNYEFGTTTVLGYANDWTTKRGRRERPRTFDGSNFSTDADNEVSADYLSTEQEITVNLLNSTGFEWGDANEVALTTFLVRKSSKEAQINRAVDFDKYNGELARIEQTDWIERQVWQVQLGGEHEFMSFGDLGMDWRVAYGEADRDQPYERSTAYTLNNPEGTFQFDNTKSDNFMRFSEVLDENVSAGIDFEFPTQFGGNNVDVMFGAAYADNSRENAVRQFDFRGSFADEILGSRADIIFSDAYLGTNEVFLDLQSTRTQPDNFDGSLETTAAYAMADADLGEFFRLSLGGRYEESTQEVSTFVTKVADSEQQFPALEEEYFLPAATLTWIPYGNFQLRAGYSETITRPQFRELSPTLFRDTDTDVGYRGNPFLKNAEITNYDVRAEWYYGRGEFLTVGVFFKDIENAIEEFVFTDGDSDRTSFGNVPSAEAFGFEFEFEKDFDMGEIFGANWAGKDLVFKTNYTYTDTEVSDEGNVTVAVTGAQITSAEVPTAAFIDPDFNQLQGAAENLFNLQLGINDLDNGTEATLLVNYADESIRFRGQGTSAGNATPPVIREPETTIDLVVNQDLSLFNGDYVLGVKVQNITNEDFNLTRTDEQTTFDYEKYDQGRTFAVSLKKEF